MLGTVVDIAGPEDMALFNSFLADWLAPISADQILELDVSKKTLEYKQSAI
jgi:hypothetical protein